MSPLGLPASRHEATYLRAILTVPLLHGTDPHDAGLWARTLPNWTFEAAHALSGELTPGAEQVLALVSPADRLQARAGVVALAHYPQSSEPPPLFVHLTSDGRGVTLRIFSRHLTELQALAERLTGRLSREPAFGVSNETRVIIAIVVEGQRHDLTGGRVTPGRSGTFASFYSANKYVLNATLTLLLFTLAVVLSLHPLGPYTPLGKFYGLNERVLSAVLLNVLLLGSQFLYFARHRQLIAWERP